MPTFFLYVIHAGIHKNTRLLTTEKKATYVLTACHRHAVNIFALKGALDMLLKMNLFQTHKTEQRPINWKWKTRENICMKTTLSKNPLPATLSFDLQFQHTNNTKNCWWHFIAKETKRTRRRKWNCLRQVQSQKKTIQHSTYPANMRASNKHTMSWQITATKNRIYSKLFWSDSERAKYVMEKLLYFKRRVFVWV